MSTQKYKVRYKKLIEYCKNNPTYEGYVEKHHIIPQCLGGSNDASNLIALSPRAHYIAHWILYKAYPENSSLAHAFAMMMVNNPNQNRAMPSLIYEQAKIARSKAMTGKPMPEWVKEKIRKPKYSNKNYFGNKNAAGNKGQKRGPRSSEHQANLIKSLQKIWEAKNKKTARKIEKIKNDFIKSGLTRKQYSEITGINYTTLKGYLNGVNVNR